MAAKQVDRPLSPGVPYSPSSVQCLWSLLPLPRGVQTERSETVFLGSTQCDTDATVFQRARKELGLAFLRRYALKVLRST